MAKLVTNRKPKVVPITNPFALLGNYIASVLRKVIPDLSAEDALELSQSQEYANEIAAVTDKHRRRAHGDFSRAAFVYLDGQLDLPERVEEQLGLKPDIFLYPLRSCPGRREYGNREAEVFFFATGEPLSDHGLAKEYKRRGMVPANPHTLVVLNKMYRGLRYNYPHATHWLNRGDSMFGDKNFGSLSFSREGASVSGITQERDGSWWYAGERA